MARVAVQKAAASGPVQAGRGVGLDLGGSAASSGFDGRAARVASMRIHGHEHKDAPRFIRTHLLFGGHDCQVLVGHREVLLQLRQARWGDPVELRRQHFRCHHHSCHPRHPGHLTMCHRGALLYCWGCRVTGGSAGQCLVLLLRRLLGAWRTIWQHPSYLSKRSVLPDASHRIMCLRSALCIWGRMGHGGRLERRTIHSTLLGAGSLVGRAWRHARSLRSRGTRRPC